MQIGRYNKLILYCVFLNMLLTGAVSSTQKYPLFNSAKKESNRGLKHGHKTKPNVRAAKPEKVYRYNGFITINNTRRFFVNAEPLSQTSELKLVAVVNAGRSLVLLHKTRGRINLHLGQASD